MIDQHDQIGGAWRTLSFDEFSHLEIGCHIWDVNKVAYDFLRNYLNMQLHALSPQPTIILGKLMLPYDWKIPIEYLRMQREHISQGAFKMFFKELVKPSKHHFSLLPKKYLYPLGGSGELMEKLEEKLKKTGIEIMLSKKIDSIHIGQEKSMGWIETEGHKIEAKEIIITSFSEMKKIHCGNEPFEMPEIIARKYIHMHLVLSTEFTKKISYIRVLNHPIIHRISDATEQMLHHGQELNGKKVVLAGVFEDAYQKFSDKEKTQAVIDLLKKHHIIGSEVELLNHYWNVFPVYRIPLETRDKIEEKFGTVIKQLPTANFIYGIVKKYEHWGKLIS